MFPLTTYFAFLQDFSTGKTFCFFTFNMFQILLITFPQGFHVTLYCLVFQTLSTVVIVLLFQCICCQDLTFFFIFFISRMALRFSLVSLFSHLLSQLLSSPYYNSLIALICFLFFKIQLHVLSNWSSKNVIFFLWLLMSFPSWMIFRVGHDLGSL